MDRARVRVKVAFEFFEKLGVPFFAFHDRDVAPEGSTLKESHANLDEIVKLLKDEMGRTGVKLLWGTANLFSNPRYAHGAATSPNLDVFAYAAAQVKKALEVTLDLGGLGYTFWGGREGYSTLWNTDLKREVDHLGRFLHMAVDYKKQIGFNGPFYIEPKPKEPTKHQYDSDAAACLNFLRTYGLLPHFKLNLETNHATLAGHEMMHEMLVAIGSGALGSLDANTGDPLIGWDTDQFPTDIYLTTKCMLCVLGMGGLTTGGVNFDAKVRRESFEPVDLFHAHIGGMDAFARGLEDRPRDHHRRPPARLPQGSLQELGRRTRPEGRGRPGQLHRPRSLHPAQGRGHQQRQRPAGDAREPDQRVHLNDRRTMGDERSAIAHRFIDHSLLDRLGLGRGLLDPEVEAEGLDQPLEAVGGDDLGGPDPDRLAGVGAPESEVDPDVVRSLGLGTRARRERECGIVGATWPLVWIEGGRVRGGDGHARRAGRRCRRPGRRRTWPTPGTPRRPIAWPRR